MKKLSLVLLLGAGLAVSVVFLPGLIGDEGTTSSQSGSSNGDSSKTKPPNYNPAENNGVSADHICTLLTPNIDETEVEKTKKGPINHEYHELVLLERNDQKVEVGFQIQSLDRYPYIDPAKNNDKFSYSIRLQSPKKTVEICKDSKVPKSGEVSCTIDSDQITSGGMAIDMAVNRTGCGTAFRTFRPEDLGSSDIIELEPLELGETAEWGKIKFTLQKFTRKNNAIEADIRTVNKDSKAKRFIFWTYSSDGRKNGIPEQERIPVGTNNSDLTYTEETYAEDIPSETPPYVLIDSDGPRALYRLK